jgi:hypothetical protein
MKTIKYSLLLAIVFLIVVPGCKKFDLKTDELTLSADLSVIKTMVNFTYLDAATGQIIEITPASPLNIEVISPINGLVVNTMGEYQNTFSPNYGFFSFSLNPYSTIPTAGKPIPMLVKTKAGGFIENIQTITLSEERLYNQEVRLINQIAPPDGVLIEDHADIGTTSASGITQEKISVNTTESELIIEIEAGTILKDESGQPLSGTVSIEIMSVDVSTAEGYRNVPALSQPLITEDGSTSALFSPIAYTRVGITDETGRKATSVTGKDMIFTTALRSDIINPQTGKPITTGDLVPSYYFDENDGNWKFFGRDTVSEADGQLQLVKIIKSKKSAGGENFSQITYSFDQNTAISLQININLPAEKPSLPTTFNVQVEGLTSGGNSTELFNNEITLFTISTSFNLNNLNPDYASYRIKLNSAEMTGSDGVSQEKTLAALEAASYLYTFNFEPGDFKDPVEGDGPTRLYLQFSCIPTSGNPLFLDSPSLPNSFYLIFSGSGFTGETVLQIQGGTFIIPFNPMLQSGGSWQAKVVMGDMEYPEGSGRVSVTSADFELFEGKVIFNYSPETAEGCDDFKKALGIN